ncbi:MAG TPA: HAD hydrolase family protein [Pyrinomonadaceae bacterium]|jgi:3-deoxy-D-manno-octulosonate 8-phosphate phosphatase (KDO 8-P phosphatase)|nr:HAD hydrolase family protein [Pyrinomonadaceae bacterium]
MTSDLSSEVQQRAARIKLLLMDCDGVLTDGRIWLFENGEEQKGFHTRDGLGIDLWHRAGLSSGIISGRESSAVERRARALGMTYIWQGRADKEQVFAETLSKARVTNEEVAYIGDDLNDIPLMLRSGLGVAVADASLETRLQAHYVTNLAGGYGAVREVIELILKAQGRWADLIRIDTPGIP